MENKGEDIEISNELNILMMINYIFKTQLHCSLYRVFRKGAMYIFKTVSMYREFNKLLSAVKQK